MERFLFKTLYLSTLSALGLFVTTTAYSFNGHTIPTLLIKDSKHDISLPLRNVPLQSQSRKSLSSELNHALNMSAASLIPLKAFRGIGVGLGSYSVTTVSPNVTGAPGMTQYLQWVDPDLAVFDKLTGTVAAGFPKPGNSIWFGFGGPCESQNMGVAFVKYDQIAHRWMITRQAFADVDTGPYYQCVAISTSDDATGSWYRYAFQMDSLSTNGILALWIDGYYLGMQMLGPVSEGPRACVLERDKMLLGLPATAQCKQLTNDQKLIVPADLNGTTLPQMGSPAYFFSVNPPHEISLVKFFTDWAHPENTSISTAINIPVPQFTKACGADAGSACANQPDTTTKLDVFGDTFPSRIAYRQFPNFGSFVAVHNVQGPPPKLSVAPRWYEMRITNDVGANPVIYQLATYAPDSKNRFTGSIGIDRFQNIAMGYTVSSSAVHPSPEMGYRQYFDPLNALITQPLVTGLGSQLSVSDWTYSTAMAIDPVDNCTFWYTSEYLQTDGSFNWSTAVINFKLAGCA